MKYTHGLQGLEKQNGTVSGGSCLPWTISAVRNNVEPVVPEFCVWCARFLMHRIDATIVLSLFPGLPCHLYPSFSVLFPIHSPHLIRVLPLCTP